MELTKGQQVEIRRKQRQWMVFPERLFQLAYDQIPDAPYEFKIRLIESRQQNWPLTNDDIKVLSALANHQSIDPLIVKPSKKRQTSKKVSQAELDSLHQQLKGLIANYQALLGRA